MVRSEKTSGNRRPPPARAPKGEKAGTAPGLRPGRSTGVFRDWLSGNGPYLGIFLLALICRVIYILQQRANPQFDAPILDPAYHDEWAWQLATGVWKPTGPFFRAPLYPIFLAGIYRLAGHNYLVPRLVQAVIGSASCVLVGLIGTRLFSRAVGLLAGLGAALYAILIYFDGELQFPVLLVFLVLAFFYTLLCGLGEPSPVGRGAPGSPRRAVESKRDLSSPDFAGSRQGIASDKPGLQRAMVFSAASGAFFGLAAITNPPVGAFLPGLAWVFWHRLRRGWPWKAMAAFLLLALIPVAIVTMYNATAGGDFVVIASQGGVNFYIGNNEQSDGQTAIVPGTRADWWGGRFDTIRLAEAAMGRPLRDSEVSNYWYHKALAFIAGHPLAWLKLTARKFALFWSAVEIGNNEFIPHALSYSPIMRLPFLGFGLVTPLAFAGFYLAWRLRRRAAILPALWIVLFMLGVIAFFVCARYRVPTIPFLLIFAALAVVEGVGLWRRGDRGPVGAAVLVFVLGAAAVDLQAIGHHENIAQARFHDGISWRQKGNVAEAERAFRDAVRLDPSLGAARDNLANLMASRGSTDEARRDYEQAIMAEPRNAQAYANLAGFYVDGGNLAAADSLVAQALAIDPDFSEALRVRGVICEARGDLAGARDAYTHALRFTRERPRLENNLAGLSLKEGKYDDAEQHLRTAVSLQPSYALAWSNLGVLYVKTNRLPQAAEAWQHAAELEPGSRKAWLQLAEVLERLGKTAEAAQARGRASQAGQSSGGGPHP